MSNIAQRGSDMVITETVELVHTLYEKRRAKLGESTQRRKWREEQRCNNKLGRCY